MTVFSTITSTCDDVDDAPAAVRAVRVKDKATSTTMTILAGRSENTWNTRPVWRGYIAIFLHLVTERAYK
jgi:hypothetical protein